MSLRWACLPAAPTPGPTSRCAWWCLSPPAAPPICWPAWWPRASAPASVNKGGAGGNLGATEVARAKPDGYTLLLGTPGTQVTNRLVYQNTGYDAVKDFTPVAHVANVANVVLTSPATGFKDMADLIRAAKARPSSTGARRASAAPGIWPWN